MDKLKLFKIIYNHGLHSPITIEAKNKQDALNNGLAIYRKRCEFVDFSTIDYVIQDVIELQ